MSCPAERKRRKPDKEPGAAFSFFCICLHIRGVFLFTGKTCIKCTTFLFPDKQKRFPKSRKSFILKYKSGQQDLNLRPHGPLTIAQMNLLLHLPSHETKCNKKCNKTKERTFCTCSKINSNTKKLFRQDSFFKF